MQKTNLYEVDYWHFRKIYFVINTYTCTEKIINNQMNTQTIKGLPGRVNSNSTYTKVKQIEI